MSNEQDAHHARIDDQFTRQAAEFAAAPELHNDEILDLLIRETAPAPDDETLDVACGPGSVVVAFAKYARHATGVDATGAMLEQAEALAAAQGISNVIWRQGDVYELPFADAAFDIVTCRFAFHHLQDPQAAFREMVRVCRSGGLVVLCDGIVVDDPVKAASFNRMEKLRDPSTVTFRPSSELVALFAENNLPPPAQKFFQVPAEREQTISRAFPENGDYEGLRQLIDEAAEDDAWGVGARRSFDTVLFSYPSVILTAIKP